MKTKKDSYFTTFTGLSEVEKEEYLKAHEKKHRNNIVLHCKFHDVEQKPMGSLSTFNNSNGLNSGYLIDNYACLLGVKPNIARIIAECTAKE